MLLINDAGEDEVGAFLHVAICVSQLAGHEIAGCTLSQEKVSYDDVVRAIPFLISLSQWFFPARTQSRPTRDPVT